MPDTTNRRRFIKGSLLAGGLASMATFEHQPLIAKMQGRGAPTPDTVPGELPMSKIGKLNVTRLLCGGNLFSGFAHSGDLLYVSSLLQHYFVEDKIMETLQLCEENGINTAVLRTDSHIVKVLSRYRKERGGKIQWIAQTYPEIANLKDNVKMAIDNGAAGAFTQGLRSELFNKEGRFEMLAEVLALIKQNGMVAGLGCHQLAIMKAMEAMKMEPDFYFKTHNKVGYESEDPATVAAYMKTKPKPWIAFKVLGAGRMQPREGFDMAFQNGADFVNVGMYDFQVKEDVALVKQVVAAHAKRERPWSA
jgi:hypothetical protein